MTATNSRARKSGRKNLDAVDLTLTKNQLSALVDLEKRNTSLHEIGHATVCARFGGSGRIDIWRNSKDNVAAGEKAWLGTFRMLAKPGSLQLTEEMAAMLHELPTPRNWRVLLGLAGIVCEQIGNGITDIDDITGEVQAMIEMGDASESDAALIGEDWDETDIEVVVKLLMDSWPNIEREITAMMAWT
ncbi:MAG: hypothetical protein WCV99_16895 [Sterolibacterium sp.]